MDDAIWVVVSTASSPRNIGRRVEDLVKTGVDMLYPRRFKPISSRS